MGNAPLCLKFLMEYPELFPCLGIERTAEMKENLAVWESGEALTEEDRAELDRLAALLRDRFCRGCGYCLPCPEGIPISTVTFLKVLAKQMPRQQVLTDAHRQAVELAEHCTDCRRCVEKCSFSLDIPEMIRENVRFYKEYCAQEVL